MVLLDAIWYAIIIVLLINSSIVFYHLLLAVFGVEPDLAPVGGTIPVARTFQEVTGKSVMLLPIGGAVDGEHAQNEKLSR